MNNLKQSVMTGVIQNDPFYAETRSQVEVAILEEISERLMSDIIEAGVTRNEFAVATVMEEIERVVNETIEAFTGYGNS